MIGTGFGKYLSLSGAYRSRIANSQGNEKSSQRFIVDCRRSQFFNALLNSMVHSGDWMSPKSFIEATSRMYPVAITSLVKSQPS